MNKVIKYYYGILPTLVSFSAAADTPGIRHEFEVFFSSGVGSIVFILLLLLILLWLLLPLAVYGLKRRLKELLIENRETNRILADIRGELATLSAEATTEVYAAQPEKADEGKISADLYNEIKFDS